MRKKIIMKERSIEDIQNPIELMKIYKNEPEPMFYWRGIEDVSFGFVFGPSKSGKTTFCENLAMSLAVGKKAFFNSPLIGKPKKVFIAAFEEDYRNRTRRMKNQISILSEKELALFEQNMFMSGKDYPRFLFEEKEWIGFENSIKKVKPDVVIIDSFTRVVDGDITNREECKGLLARFRNFAYDQGLCLIIVHHSTKNVGKPLTMDSMAGSSVLSQEADFSIGLNRNEMTNKRYLKEVFYRYEESNELVTSYSICNRSKWLIPVDNLHESKLVYDTGEKAASNYDLIVKFLNSKGEELKVVDMSIDDYDITVSVLKKEFVSNGTMKSRTFDYTLSKIVKNKILLPNGAQGNYKYII